MGRSTRTGPPVNYTAADSHEATALISALRQQSCDAVHYIGQGVCERCLSTVHDALASALCVMREQAAAPVKAELDAERAAHAETRDAYEKRFDYVKRAGILTQALSETQAERDALKAKLALAEKWAAFGAWCFETPCQCESGPEDCDCCFPALPEWKP